MPKIVQPKLAEQRRVIAPTPQPELRPVTSEAPTRTHQTSAAPIRTAVSRGVATPQLEAPGVRIGTKLSIRYLNGPRAGTVANIWFQKANNDRNLDVNGYKPVRIDSPLGEALEGAQIDDIVTFNVGNEEVRVQLIEMKHA